MEQAGRPFVTPRPRRAAPSVQPVADLPKNANDE